jgi:putative ABC transport system permease protein
MTVQPDKAPDLSSWGLTVTLRQSLLPLWHLLRGQPPAFLGQTLDQTLPADASEVHVRAAGSVHALARAGTIDASGPAATLGGSVIFMDCAAAGRLLGKPGRATRLDILLEPGSDRADVQQRLADVLLLQSREPRPEDFLCFTASPVAGFPAAIPWTSLRSAAAGPLARVQTPQARDDRVRDILVGIEVGFYLCGTGALIVGMFLVYNALAVTVAERAHEIGILRSLGATRDQVRLLFLGEAFILGVVGCLLGVPLGLLLGRLSVGPMQTVVSDIFLPLPPDTLAIDPRNIAAGVLAGLITAVIAALVPAAGAAAQEPVDAVRRVPPPATWFYPLLQLISSSVLIVLGLLGIAFRGHLPPRWGAYAGLMLVLVAILVLTPLLAACVARLIRPLARRLLGIEGRLAADNLVRVPGRTGLVVIALAASVGLLVQTAGVIRSNEVTIHDWLEDTLTADLLLTSGGPFSPSGQNQPMPLDLRAKIQQTCPGTQALPVAFLNAPLQGHGPETTVLILALDAQVFHDANLERRPTLPGLALFATLAQEFGTAVVSNNFAQLHGLGPGAVVTVPGVNGPVTLRIIGTFEDYSWSRGTIFIHQDHYRQALDLKLADVFDLYLPPGLSAADARQRLQQAPWAAEQAVFVLTREELLDHVSRLIQRLYGLAYAQEAVVGLVAILGVVTALMISILQRRRELGLLRAVGATPGQVLHSVLAEAVLMGLIGTLLGVLLGLPLQWYVVQIIMPEETGFTFPVLMPWQSAATITALALVCATLAGLGPALQALRVGIAEAIAYE